MPIDPKEDFVQTPKGEAHATERVTFLATTEQKKWLVKQRRSQNLSVSHLIRQALDVAMKESR